MEERKKVVKNKNYEKHYKKKGELKLVKFKCEFCGTEWESDDFIIDNMQTAATLEKLVKDSCPVCERINEQKI